MARQRLFGVICLRLGALGLQLTNRLPHPGDYPSNCLRSCLDRRPVLRREGNLDHSSKGYVDRSSPVGFPCSFPGYSERNGSGSLPRHGPVHPVRNPAHNPIRNRGRDSAGHVGRYEVRRPPDYDRCLPFSYASSSVLDSMLIPYRIQRWRETPHVVPADRSRHNSPAQRAARGPPPE